MDNKLAAQLIAFYKSRGIDLHYLLDDAYFTKLPLKDKIRIVKEHAEELEHGTRSNRYDISRFDVRQYKRGIGEGAVAGALAGGSVGFHLKGLSRASFLPTITGAAMGAVAGGLSSAVLKMLDAEKGIRQRVAINGALQNVIKDPTDENAFNVLLLRNAQKTNPEGIGNPISDFIRKNQEQGRDRAFKQIGDKVNEIYFSN
jgi:uncharacterized membrane protein